MPDALSATFSALSDPTRRAILARLARGEATVNELADRSDLAARRPRHLKVLEQARLITRERGRINAAAAPERWGGGGGWRYRRLGCASTSKVPRARGRAGRRNPMPRRRRARRKGHFPHEREFKAPPERVFAVRDPARFAHWWEPEGMACPVCEIDLRVGGQWRTCMRGTYGEHWERHLPRDSTPRRLLHLGVEENGVRGHETVVELEFLPGGNTRLVLHRGFERRIARQAQPRLDQQLQFRSHLQGG
jgi:uncharacterized protein YndB with AHSA1/START domain/DNA-binding transcriptional ArsR family regulator